MTGQRTRILLVMEATIGGTRKHLVDLAVGLDATSFQVTVACSTKRDPGFLSDVDRLRIHGVRVLDLPMERTIAPLSDLRATWRLWRFLRVAPHDVVHTHSSKAGVLGRLAAWFAGVPTIIHTPHSFAFLHHAEFSRWRRRVFLWIERVLGRRTDRMVAVSMAEAKAATKNRIVPEERVVVVHNGIDTTQHVAEGKVPDVAPQDRVIGCVGLLEPAKGQRYLLEAVATLVGESPRLKCVLVGDGSCRADLEDQARALGLADKVVFVGARDRAIELMCRFELLVVPSLWEGLPYVILEAMALAKPVVAAAVGGCGEVVVDGETGVLIPPADTAALAHAIRDILGDPPRAAAMGRRGQERVRAVFSLERMIAAHQRLYQELALEGHVS